jgi:hypothetical protein
VLRAEIAQTLEMLERDNAKTRWLHSDGTYSRRKPEDGEPRFCAHEALLEAAKAI